METLDAPKSKKSEGKQGQRVVEALVCGLENRGHMVVMDSFSLSIELLRELARKGIYATTTIRSNRISLPKFMKITKDFLKFEHGPLEWAIHDDCQMCGIFRKDKKFVLLLSTHSLPMSFPCESIRCHVALE